METTQHNLFPARPAIRAGQLDRKLLPSLAAFFLLTAFSLGAQDHGFGPPISVPRDLPSPPRALPPPNLVDQSPQEAMRKSAGCLQCHTGIENPSMHLSRNVVLGCTDCHVGSPPPGLTLPKAHVAALHPEFWISSANPSDSDVLLNHESPEFIQFVNPGDLRVAAKACGL